MRCLSIALFALAALPSPAWACGGMFCDSVAPVDQAAERIIFSFDGEMLDIEVQISFQGQDDDFAWVVPVPAPPELSLSNDALFTAIANATQPQFTLFDDTVHVRPGAGCAEDEEYTLEIGSASVDDSGSDTADNGDSEGVHVLSNETVGPYDTVVLQASNADVLVEWLQGSGYLQPSTLGVALDPYVASDQYFVALKLSSSKNAGDLAPLRMRYPATAASIPIQLTGAGLLRRRQQP